MKKNLIFLVLCGIVLALNSCQDPNKQQDWSRVEAFIKSLNITNAGLSGGETVSGVVDSQAFTVTFNNVPAETNIAAIKLDGKYSLGAKLDTTIYDFTQGADPQAKTLVQNVGISNYGNKHNTYVVTINLSEPANAPILEKMILADAQGNTYVANIIAEDSTIYLGMEGKGQAIIRSMVVTPARSSVTFSNIVSDSILSESQPGTLTLDFLGLKTEYKIDFTSGSAGGVDFTSAVVHDFSVGTDNCPDYFAGELVRGSDFDGEHVLIVSRTAEPAATPRLLKVSDLLNDDASKDIMLNVNGIEGGTHIVSAGRLSHGHIYICNLTTGISSVPLKVYHYADASAAPEVVLNWDGTGITNSDDDYAGRLGDNISVNLDENGNGYAFFHKQEPGDKIYRFTVTNWNTFSDPYQIDLAAVCSYYGYVNEVPAEPGTYVFTSSYVPTYTLMDKDGNTLYELEVDWTVNGARPNHGVDPRVIVFNRSRYLMFTVANSQNMHWAFGPVLYISDITDGYNTLAAFSKLDDRIWAEESDYEPVFEYNYGGEDGTAASACSAQCNAAEVNGKLVVYTAAVNAGFALIEFDKAK